MTFGGLVLFAPGFTGSKEDHRFLMARHGTLAWWEHNNPQGARDADDAWPISAQLAMAERVGARYEQIPNAGHLPNIDNPAYTTELLSGFWSQNHRMNDKGES